MARFQIARLLGTVLTISVMTGYMAIPVMAAEEIAATAEAPQEAGAGIAGDAGEQEPEEETKEQTVEENADAESTNIENTDADKAESEKEAETDLSADSAQSGETGQEQAAEPEKEQSGETGQEQDAEPEKEQSVEPGQEQNAEPEKEQSGEAVFGDEESDPAVNTAENGALEGEETLPVSGAEAEVPADSVVTLPADAKEAAPENEQQAEDTVQDYKMKLTASKAEIMAGQTAVLTATITFTAPTEKSFEMTAAAAAALSWTIDGSGAAAITQTSAIKTDKKSIEESVQQSSSENGPEEGTTAENAVVYSGTITQTITITGKKEGTATVTATAGKENLSTKVKVKPVPVELGRTANISWKDTTVLTWDKVKNAGQYRVVVSVNEGKKSFAAAITVTANSCDLEEKIVALIKANRSSLTGASYSVKASVQAISTDTVHYKNGAAVSAPGFRYLKTTFLESVSRNGWFQKGGEWYFYEAGVKQSGWFAFGGKQYYLYKDGRMAHDCWVGKKYLKSSGEMARNEWVESYKYYVDKNGNKVDKPVFLTRFFYKKANGWHFKRPNGKAEFKNTWAVLFNRKYYFGADGAIKVGFFNVGGKRYFANYTGTVESGLGACRTGWVTVPSGTYWFDDNGVMQKSTWVDKKQYYVDARGRKCDWMTYNNLRNVNTSNRLGYFIYKNGAAPEQSIAGYDLAYKKGNRIMVVDLRFTKDNIPVCFHDDLIEYARYSDGSVPGSRPSVSKLTLKQLNQYDYGIKWGSKYKGTKALTLEQMAAWIAKHPDTELYIELETGTMNAAQIQKTVAVLNKYKIVNNTSMVFGVSTASDTRAQRVHNAAPSLRIGFTTSSVNNVALTQIKKAKGVDNDVFMWCWEKTGLTADKVKALRSLNVQYECGTFSTLDQILKYYAKGNAYGYNSGVETDGAVFHQLLRSATMHEKAKWEKTSKGWKYKFASGNYARSRWMTLSGKKYYFRNDAIMKTGWLGQNGKLYYFDSNGWMATGKKTINGHVYQFAADGTLVKKIK